jgi:hypothetical protein
VLGTLANVVIASASHQQTIVAQSVRTHMDVSGGLARVVEAPIYLVLTGYARVPEAHRVVPIAGAAAFLVAALALIGVKAARSPADDRRWLAIAILLILFGYAMVYCFRTFSVPPDALLTVQRYHLFPCVGLVLLLAAWAAPRLRRLDRRPIAGPALVLALGMVLVAVNWPSMRQRRIFSRLHTGQRPVLAMIDHLADAARTRGLTRDQVILAFEPLEPRWAPVGWNILRMMPEVSAPRGSGLATSEVRAALQQALSHRDRALLFADANVTGLLQPGASWDPSAESAQGQLVRLLRVHPLGRPNLYAADGWPCYLEFTFPAEGPSPRALSLPRLPARKTVELWWAEGERWSSDRRVVVRIDEPTAELTDWVLPLDRLAGRNDGAMSRVRITVRQPGPVAIGTPALLR